MHTNVCLRFNWYVKGNGVELHRLSIGFRNRGTLKIGGRFETAELCPLQLLFSLCFVCVHNNILDLFRVL